MSPLKAIRNRWLAWLLRRAAAEMRRRGDQAIPYTQFQTTTEFAEFLDRAARHFRSGDTTDGQKLWHLFAPTCGWDDAGGSQTLGNLIYGAVRRRFFPPEATSSRSRQEP